MKTKLAWNGSRRQRAGPGRAELSCADALMRSIQSERHAALRYIMSERIKWLNESQTEKRSAPLAKCQLSLVLLLSPSLAPYRWRCVMMRTREDSGLAAAAPFDAGAALAPALCELKQKYLSYCAPTSGRRGSNATGQVQNRTEQNKISYRYRWHKTSHALENWPRPRHRRATESGEV